MAVAAAAKRSWQCKGRHHDECQLADCACKCHVTAGEQTPAQKAWETRRAKEVEPKRPEVKPGGKPPISAAQQRQIKSEFALVLWAADQGAARAFPTYWLTPDDRLEEGERNLLVNAVYAELEAVFPQALKWLAKASESAVHAQLLYAIAIVAAPRLARHKVIPQELASAIVFAPILYAAQQQPAGGAERNAGAAAGVEPERTPEPHWPDRNGQIDAGGFPAPQSPFQGGFQEQAGPGDLRHRTDDPNGRGPR
jgi:hypothetical protein